MDFWLLFVRAHLSAITFLVIVLHSFLVDFGVPPLVCHHQNKKHGGGLSAQRTEILDDSLGIPSLSVN